MMRRYGARLEVAPDNMGHAGSTGSITLDVYSKTWWDERADAVTRVVEAVFAEPEEKEKKIAIPLKALPNGGTGVDWEPFWAPRVLNPARIQCKLLNLMVGERGFEPPTPWSRTRCSTRLSHSPTVWKGAICTALKRL